MFHRDDELEREKRLLGIIDRLLTIVDKFVDDELQENQTAIAVFAKGENMPAKILVGGKGATFKFSEFDVSGDRVKASGPITFASDNPSVATVDGSLQVVNADGSVSVPVVAVAANPDGTDAFANITGVDPASKNKVAAGDVLTVGAAVPSNDAVTATGVLTAN